MKKKSNQGDESYIREFANKCRVEAESQGSPFDIIFGSTIYALSSFGKKHKECNVSKELEGFGLDVSEFYSGDGALFELGCYLCFRMDLWFFKNKIQLRESVGLRFINEYKKIFSKALKMDIADIAFILEHRMAGYGKLVRTGEDHERYHYHLSQLIIRKKSGQLPKSYDFDNAPLIITGFLEDVGIKIALISWEENLIPVVFENLEMYCDLIDKN